MLVCSPAAQAVGAVEREQLRSPRGLRVTAHRAAAAAALDQLHLLERRDVVGHHVRGQRQLLAQRGHRPRCRQARASWRRGRCPAASSDRRGRARWSTPPANSVVSVWSWTASQRPLGRRERRHHDQAVLGRRRRPARPRAASTAHPRPTCAGAGRRAGSSSASGSSAASIEATRRSSWARSVASRVLGHRQHAADRDRDGRQPPLRRAQHVAPAAPEARAPRQRRLAWRRGPRLARGRPPGVAATRAGGCLDVEHDVGHEPTLGHRPQRPALRRAETLEDRRRPQLVVSDGGRLDRQQHRAGVHIDDRPQAPAGQFLDVDARAHA